MNPHKYLDMLLEGKLVATPPVEHEVAYFTGVPDNLLDITRELDIKYGILTNKTTELVGETVHLLGFIKTINGRPKANYENMNAVTEDNIKKFAEYIHYSPQFFNGGKSPDKSEIEYIIRKHLPGKYQSSQTNLFDATD